MSKSETARRLAAEQTEAQRDAVRTEGEHQRDLTTLIDQLTEQVGPLAASMATLTEETRKAVAEGEQSQKEAQAALVNEVGRLREEVSRAARTVEDLRRLVHRVQVPAWRLMLWPALTVLGLLLVMPVAWRLLDPLYTTLLTAL
ncbi:hypothetical protein SAMN05660831_02704 [Thiohalospira halophila DSM 15071]|uniref:Mobilization protein n=1 Tax=Thiohalospira halophila DSM 15071 TaxID=1123397 RepID=A0A1I1WP26_9GAMM|nr:hypothetical protein [Thiohalospira halophila]SFD96832.1 hypothetical protein SAMN05660831_02704 [Thiohalospira halophila DSM 15071]